MLSGFMTIMYPARKFIPGSHTLPPNG
ncbi:rCG24340 [Rattus norvegicus]|uniref:RCG24340 n=1 Tax=Rattus norvegicus TaxID=10116 RepID=A6K5D6_RAT|nr:rCG24340 [Rattus norvegicus]